MEFTIWYRNYLGCHGCAKAIMKMPQAMQKVCEKREKFIQLIIVL